MEDGIPRTKLDVVGISEVARMFNVNRVTVSGWRAEGLLPPVDGELSKRPLWRRSTILRWAADTGRAVIVPGPFSDA